MIENIFRALEDETYFVEKVGAHFRSVPGELNPVLQCQVEVDDARLKFAHNEYTQGVKRFSMFLQSGDPDHYKRAGALLHALYLSEPIVSVTFDPQLEDVDTLSQPLGVSYGDAEDCLSFGHFYHEYHNEFTAFSLAFDSCRQFVLAEPTAINFEYVHTVCTYLKNNGNLSVESLFIMFKSLMR